MTYDSVAEVGRQAHLWVCLHVDVDVAHAVSVAQHWDARVALDVADQLIGATAGWDGEKKEESLADPACQRICWIRCDYGTARCKK